MFGRLLHPAEKEGRKEGGDGGGGLGRRGASSQGYKPFSFLSSHFQPKTLLMKISAFVSSVWLGGWVGGEAKRECGICRALLTMQIVCLFSGDDPNSGVGLGECQ